MKKQTSTDEFIRRMKKRYVEQGKQEMKKEILEEIDKTIFIEKCNRNVDGLRKLKQKINSIDKEGGGE